jgi:carbamate kinase
MRLVIAIGGNALLERGQKPDAAVQRANIATAIQAVAPGLLGNWVSSRTAVC